ncbi:MAG: RNA 2',3'-cyclic phosphodiesterase, partial [Planctomycetota bacterium]
MRVFWAVPLPDALCRELHGIAAGVKGLRAQKPETIHLTLRFLGDIEDPQPVAEAAQAVAARHEPFTLAVCGLGVFPHPRAPRVFWAGVGRGREAVQALAEDLSEALQPLGFEPERRPWRAHMTLGRFRRSGPVPVRRPGFGAGHVAGVSKLPFEPPGRREAGLERDEVLVAV